MHSKYSSLLGLLLILGATTRLHADQLDLAVKKHAPDLIEQLRKEGVNTLGVLRFRIQIGESKPSFSVSALNGELTGLVENAIVLSNSAKKPLMLVREVSEVADKARVGDWNDDAKERAKLFVPEYPTAWGEGTKTVDGFLTGTLKTTKDLKHSTLVVELITAKNPEKVQKLAEIPFQSDTGLLTDLGRGFNLKSRPDAVRPRSASDWTRSVMEEANLLGDASTLKDLKDLGGVDFRIFADGVDITNTVKQAEDASQNQWVMPSPGEKKISFRMKNTTQTKLGVLLKLNDQNVIQMDIENQKIFLDPKKKEVNLTGFVRERNGRQEIVEFKSLVGAAAERAKGALGVKEGFLTITVFESLNDDALEEIPITERALSEKTRTPPPETARTDLKTYQDLLAKRGLMKRVEAGDGVNSREIIVPDEAAVKRIRVTTHPFPNPNPVASVTIRILPK